MGEQTPTPQEHEGSPLKSEFYHRLEDLWSQGRFVCVGLDTDPNKLPQSITGREGKQFGPYELARNLSPERDVLEFNKAIVDATSDLACAYKPNSAFYEAQGEGGLWALDETIKYIKQYYPDVPVILDFKRGDIGSTNNGYVESAFDILGADAVTIHPYLGREAMQPFLDRGDKGVLVLARTSNPGAGEFQDVIGSDGKPLYLKIAENVAKYWNQNGNCGLVVGATYPAELAEVRQVVGDIPILIPGIGAQGGQVESTVLAGRDSNKQGMIINASRSIIYASSDLDFAEATRMEAQRLTDEINSYRLSA